MSNRLTHKLLLPAAACVAAAGGVTAAVADAHTAPVRPALHAQPAAKTVVVSLHNYMFMPASITIAPGTTVKWEWKDGAAGYHNITPLKKKGSLMFKGTGARNSGSYSVKFTKKGVYYYECSIHPLSMQGKITVK